MKVEVQIDSTSEEAVMITAPTVCACRKSVTLLEELDQRALTCQRKEAYLIESQLFQRFTLKIGK